MNLSPLLKERINTLCAVLVHKAGESTATHYPALAAEGVRDDFRIDSTYNGKRFCRINHWYRAQCSVHAFVDVETGDIIKAAGYKAPAKDKNGMAVRGNLLDDADFLRILRNCDHYGGYLYQGGGTQPVGTVPEAILAMATVTPKVEGPGDPALPSR